MKGPETGCEGELVRRSMRTLVPFLVEWVLGTVAAALWCTVGSYAYAAVWCGPSGPCWIFIAAVWLYGVIAMLLYPAVVTLSQMTFGMCGKGAQERLEGARSLITAALTICISISMSTALYYSSQEITLAVVGAANAANANSTSMHYVNYSAEIQAADAKPGRRALDPSESHRHWGVDGGGDGHDDGGKGHGNDASPPPPWFGLLSSINPPTPSLMGQPQTFKWPSTLQGSGTLSSPMLQAVPGCNGSAWNVSDPYHLRNFRYFQYVQNCLNAVQEKLNQQQNERRRSTPGTGGLGPDIYSPLSSVVSSSQLAVGGGTVPVFGGGGEPDGTFVANSSTGGGVVYTLNRQPLSAGHAMLVPILNFGLAAVFTLYAALLTRATARRLAADENGARPIRFAYHRTMLVCVGGSMASPVGYAWNLALSQLIFAPLLTVKTIPAEVTLLYLEIARAGFFVGFVGGLYLLCLRRVNKELRGRHDLCARAMVLIHDGACAIVASGLANVVDYLCNKVLFSDWDSHVAGLGVDFGIALAVVGSGAVVEASGCLEARSTDGRVAGGKGSDGASHKQGAASESGRHKKGVAKPAPSRNGGSSQNRCVRCSLPPWHAFTLDVMRWFASYSVWYPTTDALTYIQGYDEAQADGLLATIGYAVAATLALVVAAVFTTSKARLLAHHEASMRHVELVEHAEPGGLVNGKKGKPKQASRMNGKSKKAQDVWPKMSDV